jgi:hypothetical protein
MPRARCSPVESLRTRRRALGSCGCSRGGGDRGRGRSRDATAPASIWPASRGRARDGGGCFHTPLCAGWGLRRRQRQKDRRHRRAFDRHGRSADPGPAGGAPRRSPGDAAAAGPSSTRAGGPANPGRVPTAPRPRQPDSGRRPPGPDRQEGQGGAGENPPSRRGRSLAPPARSRSTRRPGRD